MEYFAVKIKSIRLYSILTLFVVLSISSCIDLEADDTPREVVLSDTFETIHHEIALSFEYPYVGGKAGFRFIADRSFSGCLILKMGLDSTSVCREPQAYFSAYGSYSNVDPILDSLKVKWYNAKNESLVVNLSVNKDLLNQAVQVDSGWLQISHPNDTRKPYIITYLDVDVRKLGGLTLNMGDTVFSGQ